MPIQIFPSMDLGNPASLSNSIDDGITRALKLEQLTKLKRENKKEAAKESIATSSRDKTSTPFTANLPNDKTMEVPVEGVGEANPDTYSKELAKIDPEAAQAFDFNRTKHEELKTKVESDAIKLAEEEKAHPLKMRLIETDAFARAYDYGRATNWQDQKGVLAFLHPYEDKGDKTVKIENTNGTLVVHKENGQKYPINQEALMYMNAENNKQLEVWAEMVRYWDKASTEKTNSNSKVVPRDASEKERTDSLRFVISTPHGKGMDKASARTLADDLANEIISIQTRMKNNKETPLGDDEARQQAWDKLSKRILPGTQTDWFDTKMDRSPRYFMNKEALDKALEDKDITKAEHARLMERGFGDEQPSSSPTKAAKGGKSLPEDSKPIAKDKKGNIVYFQPSTGKYFNKDGSVYTGK